MEVQLAGFIDSNIKETQKMEFAKLMVKLSTACLNQEPEQRPSMGKVVSSLLKIQVHLQKLQLLTLLYGDRHQYEERIEAETNVEL